VLIGSAVPTPSTSPAAGTAAWRELSPCGTPDERRELLDPEPRAAIYFGELARHGLGGLRQVEAFEDPAALESLAVVLAEIYGDPMRLVDGKPLPSRC